MTDLNRYLTQDHAARQRTTLFSVGIGAAVGMITELWGIPFRASFLLCLLATGAVEVTMAVRYVPSAQTRIHTGVRFVERRNLLRVAFSIVSSLVLVRVLFQLNSNVNARRIKQVASNPSDQTNIAEAKTVLAKAISERVKIEKTVIQEAGAKFLEASQKSPAAWGAALAFLNYKSFLNTAVAPNPGNRKLIDLEHGRSEDFYVEFDARKIPGTQTAKFRYGGFGKVLPAGSPEGALFVRIGNEDRGNATTQHFYLGAIGFELKLDGYHIRNAIINGARIVYNGGPLILENVYFVNCTFEMPPTPQSQELANAILDHVPVSFSSS